MDLPVCFMHAVCHLAVLKMVSMAFCCTLNKDVYINFKMSSNIILSPASDLIQALSVLLHML